MRSVLSNLLAAVALLHSVLGCCAHHSHAQEGGETALQNQTPAAPSHFCPDREQCDSAGSHHEGEEPCHEETCVFIGSVAPSQGIEPACLCPLSAIHSSAGATDLSQAAVWALTTGPCALHLPVRLHLAKRVLLI